MNELKLSNSLPVIETEIRQYQNLAGESIFEIGRRLKHVKEKDLVHGEFRKWHENLGINKDFASQSIKVSEELNTNVETFRHLGTTALKIITQLPEPERTKEHTTSKGETKTPDEMTVRELRELKKQLNQKDEILQQAQSQLQQSQHAEELLQSKLESIENVEPQVKTIYKEKVPKHVEEQMKDRERELIEAKQSKLRLEEKIKQLQSSNRKGYLTEDEQIGSRRFQAESDVLDLRDNINEFLKDNSINAFREGAIAASSQRTKDVLEEGIEELEAFCRTMRNSLNNRISIN